jgi:hypothetical protein
VANPRIIIAQVEGSGDPPVAPLKVIPSINGSLLPRLGERASVVNAIVVKAPVAK